MGMGDGGQHMDRRVSSPQAFEAEVAAAEGRLRAERLSFAAVAQLVEELNQRQAWGEEGSGNA